MKINKKIKRALYGAMHPVSMCHMNSGDISGKNQ